MRPLALLLVCCLATVSLAAENWPNYRGPSDDGHSDATDLPLTWSESENVTWKTAIHGRGWSSPVIWGDQIWMGTATEDGKDMFAVCVDKNTGQVQNDLLLFHNDEPRFCHALNSYASPSPVIEEGRVYVHFGSYGTACLDTASGKVLWSRRDLPCNHFRGPGSSPILFGDLLIIHFDGFDYQYVAALNKATGETVWKTDRDIDFGTDNGDFMKAYCTPLVIEVNGQQQLISPASKAVVSYDPHTGKELWKARYKGFSATARPLYGHGLLFINDGFSKASLYAIRPDGEGDVTDTHIEWTAQKSVPSKPSQLLVGNLLFMIHDSGVATCLEAKTGKQLWQERIGGAYSASPIYADGRIYLFSHEGKTTVIAPKAELEILAENTLDDGFMASPAVSGKALYLRTKSHLYRVEKQ